MEPTKASDAPPLVAKAKPEPKSSTKKRITPKSEQPTRPANVKTELDRPDMNKYYYGPPPPLQPKRDNFDMFFESISATVKTLPPKLAAEVKSRISQVIAEFELRAICEQEAQEKAQRQTMVTIPAQVVNAIDSNLSGSPTTVANQQTVDGTSVTTYVYSYQSKPQE